MKGTRCCVIFNYSSSTLTAQFHGSVFRPDLTKNSAKRVLKSNIPRKQFCLQCTFPRFVFARRFARARGRIIMKFPTRAPRLKLLSRSKEFWVKTKLFPVRRNIFEFHFRSQKCEHIHGCKTEQWNCRVSPYSNVQTFHTVVWIIVEILGQF